MANSAIFERFDASQEVTNWTMPEQIAVAVPTPDVEILDYNTDRYLFPSSSPSSSLLYLNGSINGSMDDNKTSPSSSSFKRDEDLAKVEMGVLSVIFILTLLGNCVVLLGIFFRKQKMSRMYYFILHLSVADLITAFFNVLSQLFWEITGRFQGGNFLCKFVKYTQILGPYSSSYVLVMTAIDRYQAICFPLSNCSWTARRSKKMLGLAWAISLLFSLPQVFIFSYQVVKPATLTEPAESDCWGTFTTVGAKVYVTWYSITVFIIPLVILVFAYSCITRAIWINFNMKNACSNQDNYEKKMTRQDSDEGEGPSLDESSYKQGSRSRSNSSGSITIGNGKPSQHHLSSSSTNRSIFRKRKNKLNLTLYNPSKRFLTKKASTTSSTSGTDYGNEEEEHLSLNRGINKMNVNDMKTSLTHPQNNCGGSGNACVVIKIENKNSLCVLNGGDMSSSGAGGGFQGDTVTDKDDEQRIHLIPKINELAILEKRNGTVEMHVGKEEDEGNNTLCQHGCFRNRCNFCHSSSKIKNDRRHSSSDGNNRKGKATGGNPTGKMDSSGNGRSFRLTKQHSNHLLLPGNKNRFSRKSSRGGGMNVGGNGASPKSLATYVEQQPRTHSVKGISRAKIKTIKLTVTIICCYIFCSSPFIGAQLWLVYDPNSYNSTFFTGPTFTILTLLASLNSCVNPYIFLFFNPNLLENCFHGIIRRRFPTGRFNQNDSPLSRTQSQNKKAQFSVGRTGTTAPNLVKFGGGSSTRAERSHKHPHNSSSANSSAATNSTHTTSFLSPTPLPNNIPKETQVPLPLLMPSFSNGCGPPKGLSYLDHHPNRYHLQKESGTSHKINAVELVSPSLACNGFNTSTSAADAFSLLNSSNLPEKYSAGSETPPALSGAPSLFQPHHHQQQPCGVETVLVENNKNQHHHHVGNSTLIT